MKRLFAAVVCLIAACLLACCSGAGNTQEKPIADETYEADESVPAEKNASPADEPQAYNPYDDSDYTVPEDFDEQRQGVPYGEYVEGLTYYSSIIGKNKEYAVLFPPDYSNEETYPVIYALHGFGGDHSSWSYIGTVFGNMIADGIATPAIIVMPDMWTDSRDIDDCDGYEQRASYDRFADDLRDCLMPHIESSYPVKIGRHNTAVIGLSQGGTESLAIGFLLQDRIGSTASLAPCPGVIPTEYYKGTFWNVPIMDDFVIESEETTPDYLLLSIGSLDPWNIECTQYYDKVLTEKGIEHQYYMLDGAEHDRGLWAHSFYNFARRIFK